MTTQHPLVPQSGGLLVQCEPLELLSRLPAGVVQLVYLEARLLTGLAGDENTGTFVAEYLHQIEELLKQAKRVLKPNGNLFVRFPQTHDVVDMNSALSQVFGSRPPLVITARVPKRYGQLNREPKTDRETFFWVRVSDDSVYNPILLPAKLNGAEQSDSAGTYQWAPLLQRPAGLRERRFEFRGFTPPEGREWRYPLARLEEMDTRGRIGVTKSGTPARKLYAEDLAPVAASLEWDDLPSLMSLEGGYSVRDPLPVLDRIIRLGSDVGDLVVTAQLAEIGSGAASGNHLQRRWIATVVTDEGLESCRTRLESTGAIPGVEFRTIASRDVLECATYAVSGPPLLLSPESMVSAARQVESIRRSVEGAFAQAFEKQLALRLLDHGIVAVSEFQLPGGKYRFDFFLPAPPFGIIEVKRVKTGPLAASGVTSSLVAQLRQYATSLGLGARLYGVVLGGKPADIADLSSDGVVLCFAEDNDVGSVADTIAADFQAHAVQLGAEPMPHGLAEALIADTDDISATLSKLALNLDCLFLADGRDVLEHELTRLRDEIGHDHYTAAALRVGRSVEFIIYAACRSWSVPVREPLLLGLKKLDDSYRRLKNALITYASVGDEGHRRRQAKSGYLKQTNGIQDVLNQIMLDLDEHILPQNDDRKSPINPRALLTDIRMRYGSIQGVPEAIAKCDKPLEDLIDLRNSAAHASLDGQPREVARHELKGMIELASLVLFNLSKCGTAIELDRRAKAEAAK